MSLSNLPIVLTSAGLTPQTPSALLAQLIALVSAAQPGYTANLPGSLIDDVSGTDVAAVSLCDQAMVELVNSLTPYGANQFILNQLGQIYGVTQGQPTNTSVYVVFEGPPGFTIPIGFIVSDGTYQYVIQDGGVIASNGFTAPLYTIANVSGSFAAASGTVTQLITSVPSTITLTVTNPSNGTPGVATGESVASYQSRVIQAGLATAQGMPNLLRTSLSQVAGVQSRLISILQQTGGGWEIICGGGDPYQVAYAIYQALFDISTLVGSELAVSHITQANPGVVTTNLAHGLTTGAVLELTGIVGMTQLNGVSFTATVLTPTTFSIGINTTGYNAYVSGGQLSPNPRNIIVSLNNFPDTYVIPFVNPPQETVTMTIDWATTTPNYVNPTAVAQAVQPAIVAYVNSVTVGQPMNLLQLKDAFISALPTSIPEASISSLLFSVYINGVLTAPVGTLISGDPESFFFATNAGITVVNT